MLNVAVVVEAWYRHLQERCRAHPSCQALLQKRFNSEQTLVFVENVAITHLRSPQILAFLYAASPKQGRDHIYHNLCEELGLDSESTSHPDLLRRLGHAAGLGRHRWSKIEEQADQVLKSNMCEPLLFGSMRDVALSVMLEVVGFEWFLARMSRPFGEALQAILGLNGHDLEWFFHHSEVDIQHAEEGLAVLASFVEEFSVDRDTLQNIAEITFRDNIFLKRYFGVEQAETLAPIVG